MAADVAGENHHVDVQQWRFPGRKFQVQIGEKSDLHAIFQVDGNSSPKQSSVFSNRLMLTTSGSESTRRVTPVSRKIIMRRSNLDHTTRIETLDRVRAVVPVAAWIGNDPTGVDEVVRDDMRMPMHPQRTLRHQRFQK